MVNLCTVFTLFWESCLTYIWSKKFIKKEVSIFVDIETV